MVVVLGGACAEDSDGGVIPDSGGGPPDAAGGTSDAAAGADANREGLPACMALDPERLAGGSPFGALDLVVESFNAGDCITISQAVLRLRGGAGEELALHFSYPVAWQPGMEGREVTGSFDVSASARFTPAGGATSSELAAMHVDVAKWQEQPEAHEVDVTLTLTDDAFDVNPVRVHGTFCDWPLHLCSPAP